MSGAVTGRAGGPRDLLIVGAGGFARQTAQAVAAVDAAAGRAGSDGPARAPGR